MWSVLAKIRYLLTYLISPHHWFSAAPDSLLSVTEFFPVTAARVWNSLPDLITFEPPIAVFRSRLKTHLFHISYSFPLWLYSASVVTLVALDTIIVLACLVEVESRQPEDATPGHHVYLVTNLRAPDPELYFLPAERKFAPHRSGDSIIYDPQVDHYGRVPGDVGFAHQNWISLSQRARQLTVTLLVLLQAEHSDCDSNGTLRNITAYGSLTRIPSWAGLTIRLVIIGLSLKPSKKFGPKNAKITFLIGTVVQLDLFFVYSFYRTSKFVYQ